MVRARPDTCQCTSWRQPPHPLPASVHSTDMANATTTTLNDKEKTGGSKARMCANRRQSKAR